MKPSFKLILFCLSLFISSLQQTTAMVNERYIELMNNFNRELRANALRIAQQQDRRRQHMITIQGDLAALLTIDHPTQEEARRIAELRAEVAQLEGSEQQLNRANNIGLDLFQGIGNYVVNTVNRENTIALDTNRIRNEGIVNNQRAMQQLQHLTQLDTLMRIGTTLTASVLGITMCYYGTRLAYEQIKVRLGIPELVEETSRMSTWQSFLSMFKSEKKGKDTKPTDEIILSPEIAAIAERLAEDTKETNALHLPYQNLLLYGPPGTGKTAFAKVLAHYSGMDYAILSGSRFAQFESEKAVTELFKILKWAKKNELGTILFIDEADACFRDRKTLNQNGINFVNAFLSETGTSSDKFMFVFASNYENELDAAILSRIHKKINFPLPALPEREKILNQKISKYISNDKRTYLKKDKKVTESLTIADDVTQEYLYAVAQKIEGFSGRDIDYAVSEMRMRSYRSGNNILTRNIIDMIITEKITEVTKDKKISAYQDQKATKKLNELLAQVNAA